MNNSSHHSYISIVIHWLRQHAPSMVISVLFFLAVMVVFALFGASSTARIVGAYVTCAGITFAYTYVKSRIEQRLLRRVAAKEGPVWTAKMNGVHVGTISDAEYAAIRLHILRDKRLYVAQVFNVVRVAWTIFQTNLKLIPLELFWLTAAIAIFFPTDFAAMLTHLPAATPKNVEYAVGVLGQLAVCACLVNVMVSYLVGFTYGFIDHFDEAFALAVRKHLNVAADGMLVLYTLRDIEVRDSHSAA